MPSDDDLPPLEAYYGDPLLGATSGPAKVGAGGTAHYSLITPADLASTPQGRDLLKGILPAFGTAGWYGASMAGKGFLLIDFVAVAAEGGVWFGRRVEKVRVVYVCLEGAAGIPKRIRAWEIRHGRPFPADARFVMQSFNLRDPGNVAALVEAVADAGFSGGLLVIDTLNQASPGADENSSRDMSELIAASKQIQADVGGLVLLVSHIGKDATKGLRGHSSLLAALDAAVEVRRDGDRREWIVAKAKDDADGAVHGFRLHVIEVSEDDDGDPVTSCVIVPEESAEASIRKSKVPSGGNQLIVWDALGEILRSAGDDRPTDAPLDLPQGRPAVTLENALTALRGRLPEVEAKRQKERITQAIVGLVNRGVLVMREGWLWAS